MKNILKMICALMISFAISYLAIAWVKDFQMTETSRMGVLWLTALVALIIALIFYDPKE
jgi:hypothetical protein